MTHVIFFFPVLSFTENVLTILEFDGSPVFWVVNTKSLSPEILSSGPNATSFSNFDHLVTQIKFDYLSAVLKWIDDPGPKTGDAWKIVIGFQSLFLPVASPTLNVTVLRRILGHNSIFTTSRKSPRKNKGESGYESHEVAENAETNLDQINDKNADGITHSEPTQPISSKSSSSNKVENKQKPLVQSDASNKETMH